jgi:hypothetical protein
MPITEPLFTLSKAMPASASTHVVPDELLASPLRERTALEQWESAVESKLIEWGKQANQHDDDGYLFASPQVVSLAFSIAAKLKNAWQEVPSRVVQDGSGGIVFEWKRQATSEKLLIDSAGRAEVVHFRNSKLVDRRPLSFG